MLSRISCACAVSGSLDIAEQSFGFAFDANVTDAPVAQTPDMMARMIATMCTHVSDFMYGSVIDVCGGAGLSFQEKPWSYTMEGGLHA